MRYRIVAVLGSMVMLLPGVTAAQEDGEHVIPTRAL
jgi:hypothetical protein